MEAEQLKELKSHEDCHFFFKNKHKLQMWYWFYTTVNNKLILRDILDTILLHFADKKEFQTATALFCVSEQHGSASFAPFGWNNR